MQLVCRKAPPASDVAANELKVLVGTWNVGNAHPAADLTSWLDVGLGPEHSKAVASRWGPDAEWPATEKFDAELDDCVPTKFGTYDMIVVGCQEGDYKARPGLDGIDEDWFSVLADAVGDSYSLQVRTNVFHPRSVSTFDRSPFQLLTGELFLYGMALQCVNVLGQMRIAAFVRVDAAPAFHFWQKSTEATGIGHIMNNKGGVGIACRAWDTTLCFVNSHLAAHDDMASRRDDDFAEIVAGCKFGEKLECVQAFHHVVWMGDLNYRCEYGLDGSEKKLDRKPTEKRVDDMIAKIGSEDDPNGAAARAEVFETDQLTRSRLNGDAFLGFSEGDPAKSHMPTFKMLREPGFNYKKQRTPAWCDRVLWKTAEGFSARQTTLYAAGKIGSSDHKPVAAGLSLETVAHPNVVHFEDVEDYGEGSGAAAPAAAAAAATTAGVELEVDDDEPPTPKPGVKRVGYATQQPLGTSRRSSPGLLARLFPCVCGPNADLNYDDCEYELAFESLSGHYLKSADVTGKSDPYVVFSADALARAPTTKTNANARWKTSTVKSTLNPTWKKEDVPALPLLVSDGRVLRREHLMLRVMDYDATSADDAIGYGRMYLGPLGDALAEGKTEAAVELAVPLTLHGRRAGELRGKVLVRKRK